MAPMGKSPQGLSLGHLPVTPVHTAHQKVKGEREWIDGFKMNLFKVYALNCLMSQGDKWLIAGAVF